MYKLFIPAIVLDGAVKLLLINDDEQLKLTNDVFPSAEEVNVCNCPKIESLQ